MRFSVQHRCGLVLGSVCKEEELPMRRERPSLSFDAMDRLVSAGAEIVVPRAETVPPDTSNIVRAAIYSTTFYFPAGNPCSAEDRQGTVHSAARPTRNSRRAA